MIYAYPAIFTPEKRGYVVTVPDIPEVVTEGNFVEEATEYAIDAIQLVLRSTFAGNPRSLDRQNPTGRACELSSYRC
jgi:predicted RNase H-like HicB family nuclease